MAEYISAETRRLVFERANAICEYCLIAEEDCYYRHQIEHIISLKHGGVSELDNLALSCVFCNRNKGSDIASIAPDSELVRFYNPRIDQWHEHFRLVGALFTPFSEMGEVTIRILKMNDPEHVLERKVLAQLGRYPNRPAELLIDPE